MNWSADDVTRLLHMLAQGLRPTRIASVLGMKVRRVDDKIKALATTGVRIVKPQPAHSMSYDLDPGSALRDDLVKCEAKWASLFGGPRTLAYCRPSTRAKAA